MSGWKTSCALAMALATSLATLSAEAATRARHRHHAPVLAPATGFGPAYDSYPSISGGEYGGPYGGVGMGEGFSRNSGGVNSMSNDFGTSGLLGHTNGLPVTGR